MENISDQPTAELKEQVARETVRKAELAGYLVDSYKQFMDIYESNLLEDLKQLDNVDIEGMRTVKLQLYAAEQFGIHLQDVVESGKTAQDYLNGEEQ